jgi:hypothetical protein
MPLFTSSIELSDDYPSIRPSLNLNFAGSRALDPRITFTRASVGTYVGASGLIKTAGVNEPRFDHDPTTGESLGLLIEESRTNFFENSETVGGTATGDFFRGKEIHNKSVNLNQFYFASDFANYNVSAGDKYYLTGFIRAGSQTGNIFIKWIDGLNAPVSGVNSFTYTPTTDGEFVSFEFTFSQAVSISMNCSITGGFGDDADFAIMQLEKGSFPTSYIPTSGSTATRAADTATIEGTNFSSWYNKNEGTLVLSTDIGDLTASNQVAVAFEDTSNVSASFIAMGYNAGGGGSGHVGAWYNSSGITSAFKTHNIGVTINTEFRQSFAYKLDDFSSVVNGGAPLTDNSGGITTLIDRVRFGNYHYGGMTSGHIKQFTYYPKRLTNAQLQTLTQ